MQKYDKNPSTIELELERVRRFSLLDCIRNEVKHKINILPKNYGDYLRRKIDDVIALNLLNERKVRFASVRDVKDNLVKRTLNEIDVLLQILGNDKKNRLIIENIDLLENRIKSVEQRLMALLRKASGSAHGRNVPSITIDLMRIRSNIQEFVNKFNNVFSNTYGILTSSSVNGILIDETLSSKNRLKFHLLSRLTDLRFANAYERNMLGMKFRKKSELSMNGLMKKALKGGTTFRTIVAVDSLITLRKRVKSKSVKKKTDTEKKESKFRPQKVNQNLKRKDEFKTVKKNKHKSCSEQSSTPGSIDDNDEFDIVDEISTSSFYSVKNVFQKPKELENIKEKQKIKKAFNAIPDMTTWVDTTLDGNFNRVVNTEKVLSKGETKITQNDIIKRKSYKSSDALPNRTYEINKDLQADISFYQQTNNEKSFDLCHRKRNNAEESGDYFNSHAIPEKYIPKGSCDNRADGTDIESAKVKSKSLIAPTKSLRSSVDSEKNSKNSAKKNSIPLSQGKEQQNRYSRKVEKNKRKSPPSSSKNSNLLERRLIKTVEKHRDKKKAADTLLIKSTPQTRRKSLEAIFQRKLSISPYTSSKSETSLSSESY